jgi:transposase
LKRLRGAWLDRVRVGVENDIDAVRNGIISRWSNGQTERQITRQLIKRQMYGRAKLDLLQARLITTT